MLPLVIEENFLELSLVISHWSLVGKLSKVSEAVNQ